MNVSKQKKEETRKLIVEKADQLFLRNGYESTTTREIASACGIAAGTLFNYFPTKESLAASILSGVLSEGRDDYARRRTGEEDLPEELFLLVSSELRRLRPYRNIVGPVFEGTLSLFFSGSQGGETGEGLRMEHLRIVNMIIDRHGYSHVPRLILINLYWSLYLGILASWSRDESRNQSETLILIDYAFRIFKQTITGTQSDRGNDYVGS